MFVFLTQCSFQPDFIYVTTNCLLTWLLISCSMLIISVIYCSFVSDPNFVLLGRTANVQAPLFTITTVLHYRTTASYCACILLHKLVNYTAGHLYVCLWIVLNQLSTTVSLSISISCSLQTLNFVLLWWTEYPSSSQFFPKCAIRLDFCSVCAHVFLCEPVDNIYQTLIVFLSSR